MSRKRNTFSKAVGHLKSSKISEAAPTNSTISVMVPDAGTLTRQEFQGMVPDQSTIDWDLNGDDGKDTDGIFDASGNSKLIGPPLTEDSPDNSYILGPMAAMYYTYASPNVWTMIGYIRQADRRMVNLGDIDGKLSDWDGVSNFNSYGQLTLEQARWFRDTWKHDGSGDDPANANYRAFYPGPPSSTPDAFGRYLCTITGTAKAEKKDYETVAPLDMQAADNFSAIMNKLAKGEKLSKAERDLLDNYKKSQGQENKFLDLINQGLDKILAGMEAITDNPVTKVLDQILPSKIIADTITDRIFGGDNPNSYNGQLMMQLLNSVITGNNVDIKLSKKGRQNMFDSIDASKIADAITFGSPSNPDADNAIQPGKKVEGVLTGGWGDQGGSEFNYDPETGMVTITSNKMLRKMDGDKRDSGGKIVEFEDIPNPTTEQINGLMDSKPGFKKALMNFYKAVASAEIKSSIDAPGKGWKPFAGGEHPAVAAQQMMDGVPEITKALYNFTVEGTASNAVWLRQQLVKAGISPQSESEKQGEGFGGHVYSQESTPLDKLPPKVQDAIRSKFNQNKKTNLVPGGGETFFQSRTLSGNILSESRKSIIKNLKQPVVLPEGKKKSYKVSPGKRNKTNFQGMDKLVGDIKPQSPFKTKRDVWSKDWQDYNSKQSQEKKNQVLEKIGDGKKAFNYMLTDSKKKTAEELEKFWGLHPEMHKYFYNGKEYKATRKEEVKGDLLLFMEDENGENSTILQSELSIKLAEGKERQMLDEYNEIQSKKEPTPFFKDPLMKKVAKRLKNEIEYEGKPAAKGYPNDPPPEMVNGWHPNYGKTYKYDKLDPVSAVMMRKAPTGNPEIDANVKKAASKIKVKEEKVSDWRDEIEIKEETPKEEVKLFDRVKNIQEQMTSSNLFGIQYGDEGNRDLQGWIWSDWDSDDIPNGEGAFFNDIAAGEIDEFNYPGSAGWATMVPANAGQTGTGEDGLFNLNDKQDYIHFFNAVDNDGMEGNFLRTTPIDARSLDTISIDAIVGNNSNGGKSPGTSNNWGLYVYHWHDGLPVVDGASDWQFWSDVQADYTIVPHNGAGTITNYTLTIPESARVQRLYLNFGWAAMDGADQSQFRSGDLGITRLGFQRRQPMNVIIGLDTPEGSAFVRSGSSLLKAAGKDKKLKSLSKEERYSSVVSMLNASREYTDLILGIQFPGSKTLLFGKEIQGSDVEKHHDKERARQAKIAKARFEADPNQHGSKAWREKQRQLYPNVNDAYADWADKLTTAGGGPMFPEGYRAYSAKNNGRFSIHDSRAQILTRIHPPWVKTKRSRAPRRQGRTAADIKRDFEAGKHIAYAPHREKWVAARQQKAERDLARKRERYTKIANDPKGRASGKYGPWIPPNIDDYRTDFSTDSADQKVDRIAPNASKRDQQKITKIFKKIEKSDQSDQSSSSETSATSAQQKEYMDIAKIIDASGYQTAGLPAVLALPSLVPTIKALIAAGASTYVLNNAIKDYQNSVSGSSSSTYDDNIMWRSDTSTSSDSTLSDSEWEAGATKSQERDAQAAQEANVRSQAAEKALEKAKESGDEGAIRRAEEEYENASRNRERVAANNTKNRQARKKERNRRHGKPEGGIQGNVTPSGSMGGGTFGGQYNSYEPEAPMIQETTFEKLKQVRLKFNYKGKPTPTEDGFPEEPPTMPGPDGFHPKYGKHAARYKRLDPASADAMPGTGDPETDALVDKQKSKKKRYSDFTKNPT